MKYSLFIGRFQPFHAGHEAIVQQLLSEGKRVCIGIRDTELSAKNPYSMMQRFDRIRDTFPDESKVMIVPCPDIDEVVYGRDVGYALRKIELPESLEAISGTALREGGKA